ncbi:MAG: TonB-dependent receptor [Acidobacteriia bacterium]|nr:TonB-dependent receptor [Terriglobia bacterium]
MYKFMAALALCLILSSAAFAQTLGEITGVVRDQTGAVVAGAEVTATNIGTNSTRTTLSNEAGIYSFPALTPGMYTIKVEKPGFKSVSRPNIELQVQMVARIDIDMTVGQVSESVEVSAQAALLTSETATVGTVIENKRIVELPLNGRNALSLAALSPNVSFGFPNAGQADSRQGGIRAAQSISIAGQRAQYNHFTLDGVENTDPNFNTFVVLPSVDALQEFKVQTGIYPAEFGRGASQVNMSTKSGTNDYHGTLFEFLRNEKLDAKNYAFTAARPPKDPFKWNQFGFTLGGPVQIPKLFNGKNRLFFMANYEWFRQRRSVQSVYNLPSANMQQGNFSELPLGTLGIFDPLTRTPQGNTVTATQFPGNIIPAARFATQSKQLLEFYPVPNVAGAATGARNYQTARGLPINRDQFISRLDFVESDKSQWLARYSWGDENQLTEQLKLNGSSIVTNFNQYSVTNTRILTTTIVNEFRFGLTQFYNTNGPQLAFTRDVVGELKIPGLPGGPPVQWGIPSVGFDTYSGFGNDSEGPYENNNRSLQFIDNISWIRGKHSFKFGAEIRNDVYRQVGNQFARGSFGFNRNATNNPALAGRSGDSFADFLIGEINQPEAAVSIAKADFRASTFYLYFDDSWKVTNKLTINFGLRYENTPPWENQLGDLFNGIVTNDIRPADFRTANVADRSIHPFFMRQGEPRQNCYEGIAIRWTDIAVKCDGSLGNRLVGRDNNDWAPRFGVSWSPSAKWVIRGGGGMFYSQDSGNPRFDMARNLAGRLRSNSNTVRPDKTWNNALSSIAGGVANVPIPYTFANPYDRRTPLSYSYMLNVQRELPGNTMVELGYLGSVSHHLESLRAVNEALPAPRSTGLSVPQRSPFIEFGRIQLVDNGGNGNYNALSAKFTKRFSNGLTYLLGYTYSKSIDTATAIRNQGGDTLFPQNSYCRSCERALSSHDNRQRLTASFLYELPIGKGRGVNIDNGVANAIIGGWQVGSIITLQSGFPFTFTQSGDPSNTGGQFDRPMATGSALYDGFTQDPSNWFNRAAFSRTVDGTFGNVGRNTGTSPGIRSWDFSILKNFHFAESKYLQFRFEAFNFPNHPILGNPDANISSATFGVITGTRSNMRNLQFGLKFVF